MEDSSMQPSRRLVIVCAFAIVGTACSGGFLWSLRRLSHPTTVYRFFEMPSPDDPWSRKIARWQVRQRAEESFLEPPPVSAGENEESETTTTLANDFRRIRTDSKIILAYGVTAWVQKESKSHYIPDGPYDHWATLQETLDHDGDDCDGLELLAFRFLEEVGFPRDALFHSILVRPSDGQHHMVTLWFENKDDPWVIDPTGAAVEGMKRVSELSEGWAPIKVFNETQEFTVRGPEFPKHILERPRQ